MPPELLYAWIATPEEWVNRKIFLCEFRPLRKILSTEERPLEEEGKYVSVNDLLNWKLYYEQQQYEIWSVDFQNRIQKIMTAGQERTLLPTKSVTP
ncbi:MAG: hypothetical protein R3C11_09000 [Planctomycetaceae bacterium]